MPEKKQTKPKSGHCETLPCSHQEGTAETWDKVENEDHLIEARDGKNFVPRKKKKKKKVLKNEAVPDTNLGAHP